ncbi:myrosinase 1-like isoform X2 [Eurosta solidaginis]|uniref:myrosinase 1-like isoform X2 n=1 Tax=Eurosta solidaginis TaxID=178769 RepID=UPI00353089B0
MKVCFVIFVCVLIFHTTVAENKCELTHKGGITRFPDGFAFGVGTSAYQIEGGWNADDKAPSAWDNYTHRHREAFLDWSTGDNAAESYYRFEQDLEALKKLKVNFYRFSISWTRVLPQLTTEFKNAKGIAYYNKVIDQLLANNITPLVTMFHFDMPDELYKYNAFLNSSIIDYFVMYADFLYATFGDRVKLWITHNEPLQFCTKGYVEANFPPLVHSPGVGHYICMDNMLRSHARAYRRYKEKYFSKQKGKVGITFDVRFFFKKYRETPDEAVERALQYELGWLAEPIYGKTGNYPSIMKSDIDNNSWKEGLSGSRLPIINNEWSQIIKGSADFMGLNYYQSAYVDMATNRPHEVPSIEYDSKIIFSRDEYWRRAKSGFLYCVPEGLENLLKWVRDRYDNVEVIITENGWSDDGQLDDSGRIDYLKAHLQAVLNAINDGCNVTHYTYWSFLDNFEWIMGYTEKFGLFYVNMSSVNKERVIKDSAKYYTKVIKNRRIVASNGGQQYCSNFVSVLLSVFVILNFYL